ncbi:Ig-like domain-containing protein [Paenibacillus sp. YIM B09110]|uniref:Ig-like domain-containing protein n=1 Tax=Paenibacillus sp. YIM B09110 TaxID=3126102 RepID=UPI00301D7370
MVYTPRVSAESQERGYTQISGGNQFTVALKADGSVWAWGYNAEGELGNGTFTNSPTPTKVLNLNDVVAVATGDKHALALKRDGTVWAWGDNDYGLAGMQNWNAHVSVPVQINTLSDITSISAASSHSLALKSDGTVWTWGLNQNGSTKLTSVLGLSDAVTITAGAKHNLAIKKDGTVFAWGDNTYGQSHSVNLTNAKDISASEYYSVVLKDDGTIWIWGRYKVFPWQLKYKNGNVFKDVHSISSSGSYGLAMKEDGTVWTFPFDSDIQDPEMVSGIYQAIGINAGSDHILALKSDGTVWGWGANVYGQLGDGTLTNSFNPTLALGTTHTSNSELSATLTNVSANGTAETKLLVKLVDKLNRPVQGHTVRISQNGNSKVSPIEGITDDHGLVVFAATNTIAENVTYTAIDTTDKETIRQHVDVQYSPDTVSMANSTFTASSTYLPADGTTSGTLTVTLRDSNDNPINQQAVRIDQGSGSAVITPINGGVTDTDGEASFLVTNSVSEIITVSATHDQAHSTLEQSIQITFNPATPNAEITSSSTYVEANGTDSSSITVTLLDAEGAPIPGHIISLTQGSGTSATILPNEGVTDANGQTVFSVMNSRPENVAFTATDVTEQTTVDQSPIVTFYHKVTDIELKETNLTLKVGQDISRLKAQVFPNSATNKQLIWSSSNPDVATVSEDGTVTPLSVGSSIVTVTTIDQEKTASCVVTVLGLTDEKASTVSTSATSTSADRTSQVTIVAKLVDSLGNPMSNHSLILSQGEGSSTITPLSDSVTNANGQAWFTVSNTKAETVTYTLTDNTDHVTLLQSAQVVFKAGLINWQSSIVSASSTEVEANGIENSTITVIGKDFYENLIPNVKITLTQGNGSRSTITPVNGGKTDANGVAKFTVTSKYVETVTYSASAETTPYMTMLDKPQVKFIRGPANTSQSTLTASSSQLLADGTSGSTLIVTLKSSGGHPIDNHKVTISQGDGNSTITPVNNGFTNAQGQARFIVTNKNVETVTYVVKDSIVNENFEITTTVTFIVGPTSPTNSYITATPSKVELNGQSSSTLIVTLRDAMGHRVPNKMVKLTQGGGSSSITPAHGQLTDAYGQATFTVTNTKEETVTYTGIDAANSAILTTGSSVNFYVNHVVGVILDQAKMTIRPGDGPVALSAQIIPDNATNKQLSWSSSNPAVAQVDQNGIVTPLSPGTAIIKVISEDGRKEATRSVVVSKPAAGPPVTNISITNNLTGVDDLITVKGLASGSIVKIYRQLNDRTPIAQGSATLVGGTRNYEARIAIPQLSELSGSLYVSVTNGISESGKTLKNYAGEPSVRLNAEQIRVYNNVSPIKDTVTVSQINAGDSIQIYNNNKTSAALAKATATSDGEVQVSINQLGRTSNIVLISITRLGYSESEKLPFTYEAEPPSGPSASSITVTNHLAPSDSDGKADYLTISGLSDNDLFAAYDQLNDGALIGKGVAGSSCSLAGNKKTCTITVELPSHKSGTVYISVTRAGVESARTPKSYLAEPSFPVNMDSSSGSDGDVFIRNNYRTLADLIQVTHLSAGDVVKIYNEKNVVLATSKPVADGQTSIMIPISQLGTNSGKLYVSVIRKDYLESAKVAVAYPEEAPSGPAVSSITVTNNIGLDQIYLTGLEPKDLIKVYNDASMTTLITTEIADSPDGGNKATASLYLSLPSEQAGKIYITLTRQGVESSPTEKAYAAQPSNPITEVTAFNNLVKPDLVVVGGLATGDIVKVYKDESSKSVIIGTSKPVASGQSSITVSIPQFSKDLNSGVVFVSVIRKGYLESERIPVVYQGAPPAAPLTNAITVVNRYGTEDIVQVTGLKAGDFVHVYNNANMDAGALLVEAAAEQLENGSFVANTIVTLNPGKGSVYVSIVREGIESDYTSKAYSVELSPTLDFSQIDIYDYVDSKVKDKIIVSYLSKGTTIKVYLLNGTNWKILSTSSNVIAANGSYQLTLPLNFPNEWFIKITQTVTGHPESEGAYFQLSNDAIASLSSSPAINLTKSLVE